MNTIEIPDRNLKIEVPENWHEMTPDQRAYCLKYAINFTGGVVTYTQFLTACFFKLANVQRTWRTYLWEKAVSPQMVSDKNANILIYAEFLLAGLFKDVSADKLEVEYDTELLPFSHVCPRVGLRSKKLYLPDVLLQSSTFGEFRHALSEMNLFFESKAEEDLNRFLAVLCRPQRQRLKQLMKDPNFDGQKREPFNPNRVEINARWTAHLKPWQKKAVLLWFAGTVQLLQTAEELNINDRVISLKELFPQPLEGEETTPPDQSAAGWKGVLMHIAKEGVFGTTTQTDQQNLFDILEWMYDQHEETKRIKRKLK